MGSARWLISQMYELEMMLMDVTLDVLLEVAFLCESLFALSVGADERFDAFVEPFMFGQRR
jgi:hypothetical protein